MQIEKAAKTTFVQKIRTLNVDEIDTRIPLATKFVADIDNEAR